MDIRGHLRRYVTPPIFAGDEEKTRSAAVLNVLQLTLVAMMALASIAVVFVFTKKLESLAVVVGLLMALGASRISMYRGHVRRASLVVVAGMWGVVTLLLALGGGLKSVDVVQYVALTVIGGLLLGPNTAIIIAIASGLTGLGFVVGEHLGYTLPQLFPNIPLSNWIKFVFGLAMTVFTLNIALRGLHDALALSRQRLQEREKAEAALRRSESRLRAVLDAATDISFIITDANDVEPRVLEFSPGAERIFGYQRDEMLGQPITTLHTPEDIKQFSKVGQNIRARKSGFSGERLLVRKSGETFPALFTTYPLFDAEGEMYAVLSISIDITGRKQAEQERERLLARVQQQERLAALGQLSAGIAHDFNNIMATIVLYTQLSARTPGVPPRVQERLATIYQQAEHATALVQQILDFGRRAVFERQPLDVAALLDEQVQVLKRTLPESIQVTLTCGADEYIVQGAATSIQQVVMNLAVNARDAMPEGGVLHFDLARIHITGKGQGPLPELESGDWVQITVTDTGAGIAPDVLPHIFDPFFTTKEPGKGSGLGLAQVYGIVDMHKGHIEVKTQPERGAAFVVYLPAMSINPHPATSHLAPEEQPPQLTTGYGETILIVEDNPTTRMALVDGLESLGYRIQVADNGRQALDLLMQNREKIDLVLSDVVMPELGGVALLRALKQHHIHTPVVLLTGHPLGAELRSLPADDTMLLVDWLLKPVDLATLSEAITRALKLSISIRA